MSNLASPERPLRVAIVGCGPSGFYAAEALLKRNIPVQISMLEKLPAPFGLVRYGVAPDHAKIKGVTKVFEKTLARPGVNYYGNIPIGKSVAIEDLKNFFDAVIITTGAETDRQLNVPGEDLPGNYTATAFVAWYNGHPEYKDSSFNLSSKKVVIIGQGNVAMDVCRILCKSAEELKATDISSHALEQLSRSRIEEVHLIGRRGPVQAAFTNEEIKEFGHLQEAWPVLNPEDFDLNEASRHELEDPHNAARKRNYEILRSYLRVDPAGRKKKLVIHFYKSPKRIEGAGQVQKIILEKNRLEGSAGRQKAVGTGEMEALECGAVFRSVGYKGLVLKGVPFDDEVGIIPNIKGRVLAEDTDLPGLYTSGWIKRGSSGVIGTNKPDSEETVQSLMEDLPRLRPCADPSQSAFEGFLRDQGVVFVSFADWQKIDAEEVRRGQALGKPREKFTDVEEMLKIVRGA